MFAGEYTFAEAQDLCEPNPDCRCFTYEGALGDRDYSVKHFTSFKKAQEKRLAQGTGWTTYTKLSKTDARWGKWSYEFSAGDRVVVSDPKEAVAGGPPPADYQSKKLEWPNEKMKADTSKGMKWTKVSKHFFVLGRATFLNYIYGRHGAKWGGVPKWCTRFKTAENMYRSFCPPWVPTVFATWLNLTTGEMGWSQ